jgi:hypothetical protein
LSELEAKGITGRAIFSVGKRYRYVLTREWSGDPSRLLFVMLNPSIADDKVDDPTQRRCRKFARDWGFGGYTVANIFAYVSTDPDGLKGLSDPVGPQNDIYLRGLHMMSEKTIAAWGTGGAFRHRGPQVYMSLSAIKPLYCLAVNSDGSPGHPLYLKADLTPKEYAA